MTTPDLGTVLTSAAVAALISSGITWLNGWQERRSRRDELLLQKALELASLRVRHEVERAERRGACIVMADEAAIAAEYFRGLQGILRDGKLPPDAGVGTCEYNFSDVSPPLRRAS